MYEPSYPVHSLSIYPRYSEQSKNILPARNTVRRQEDSMACIEIHMQVSKPIGSRFVEDSIRVRYMKVFNLFYGLHITAIQSIILEYITKTNTLNINSNADLELYCRRPNQELSGIEFVKVNIMLNAKELKQFKSRTSEHIGLVQIEVAILRSNQKRESHRWINAFCGTQALWPIWIKLGQRPLGPI